MGTFAWELLLRNFCLELLLGNFCLETFAWELLLRNFRLELSLRNFRLGTFAWDLLLGLAGLAGWLGLPGLAGWFQICPGNQLAWLAGFKFARGTGRAEPGEPAGPGDRPPPLSC